MTVENLNGKIDRLEEVIGSLASTIQELSNESLNGRTSRQEVVKTNPDSITLGAPSNGQIKVYGDLQNPREFAKKIKQAQRLRCGAQKNNGEQEAR